MWNGIERRHQGTIGRNQGRRKQDRPNEQKAADDWYPMTPIDTTSIMNDIDTSSSPSYDSDSGSSSDFSGGGGSFDGGGSSGDW